jgi:hypothetical protein
MEEAESQNVYPFRDDRSVFFRVPYSITKEALALTRRTSDSEIIAGVWRHRHTLNWSQNYFRVAVMTDASRTLRLTVGQPTGGSSVYSLSDFACQECVFGTSPDYKPNDPIPFCTAEQRFQLSRYPARLCRVGLGVEW